MELANLIALIILNFILICVTIGLAINQNNLSKKMHHDQMKSNLFNERKQIYLNLYNTFVVIENKKSEYPFLLDQGYIKDVFSKMLNHREHMMLDSNLVRFLFKGDDVLLAKLKNYYELFEKYFIEYMAFFSEQDEIVQKFEKEYNTKLSSKNASKFQEYLTGQYGGFYQKANELINYLNDQEFIKSFEKYLYIDKRGNQ